MVKSEQPGPGPESPVPGEAEGARQRTRELAFISPQGAQHRVQALFGPDRPRLVRPPAVARQVRLSDGFSGFQVRLPASEAGNSAGYGVLEAEISAALTLFRGYAGTRSRGLFPVPVGYDMNAVEPFVLYAVPRGRPVSALTQAVSVNEQRGIERDLVLAVRLMESVGLVHRGIVPAAVRWDGGGVQLWDLGSVTRTGRPRVPYGVPPFASPEQRAGVGEADPRDALWSVGQVLHQLVTGRPGNPDGPAPDLARHRSLALTLTPVFAPRAADRPSADRLLDLLMPDADAQLLSAGLPDPLDPFRRDYDESMRRKHASLGRRAGPPPDYPPDHPAPPGRDPRPADGQTGERGRLRTWFYGGSTTPGDTEGGQYR